MQLNTTKNDAGTVCHAITTNDAVVQGQDADPTVKEPTDRAEITRLEERVSTLTVTVQQRDEEIERLNTQLDDLRDLISRMPSGVVSADTETDEEIVGDVVIGEAGEPSGDTAGEVTGGESGEDTQDEPDGADDATPAIAAAAGGTRRKRTAAADPDAETPGL